jgi:hypothetical protein
VIATTQEITNVTRTTMTTNGKVLKKRDRGNSRESSTMNIHRQHDARRKRSGTKSR